MAKRETTLVESKRPSKKSKNDPTPSPTLYIKNLNDNVTKTDLKRYLYMRFSSYGHILDIVAVKNDKMRGQAHIVFNDVDSSTSALNGLQKTEFMGKQLEIEYARGKSHAIAKLDGSFVIPAPPQLDESKLPLAPFEDVTVE